MFGASSAPGTGFLGQNKPASFLFGSSNTNNMNANNTNNTAPNNNTNAASGFSLGGSNANSAFGNKPAGSGFGANAPAASGNLFGGSSAAAGSAPSTGGLFGNTGTNTGNGGTAPGGLFGAPATNTAPATGTSLFGGNNAASSSTAFGKPAGGPPGAQPTTGGGLFGSSQPAQQGPAAAGGLFGKPAGTASAGLFGGGSAPAQPSAAPGGGLFGNKSTSGGLFGAPQAPNTAPNFALNNNNPGMPGSTANSAQPAFSWSGQQAPGGPASTLSGLEIKLPASSKSQPDASNYTPAVNDQLTKLREQWDPRSAKCALKTHLYNKFSEQEIAVLLQQPRPASESPEDWEKAMAQRPSPLHYPVKVTSFTEMAQRVEVQLEHVAKSRVFLNNIYEKQAQLSAQRDLDTTTRIMKAKARHTKLSRRLLKLATLLAVLKLKGYPLLPEEEEISRQFQVLNAALSDPNGAVGKLSDLYARLAILKGRSEDLSSQLESSITTMNGGLNTLASSSSAAAGEGATPTEQAILLLTKLLYKQQIGLGYLNDVVQQDLAAVDRRTK